MCLSSDPKLSMETGAGKSSNGTSSPHNSTSSQIRTSSPCSSPNSGPPRSHSASALNLLSSSYLPRSHLSSPPPRRSPSSLVPSAAMSSMVSMASMLGHHGSPFLPPGYPRDFAALAGAAVAGRSDDFAASMHKFMDRSFGDSPPPVTVPTNDPTANECKIVDYRGEKVAAFMIAGKTMLCLPQAFELFLKHLVGGLHTVYTKLKRLEITPIVCNVEQVRILRGLGAIQPGVNRCKLLADTDFDALFKDCTTSSSRPGRPPKRGVPFPSMSPQNVSMMQDAMMHLKNSMHNGSAAAAAAAAAAVAGVDLYKDVPYGKEPRIDKSPFGNGFGPHPPGLSPMAAQFMALNNPAAAAQAAFFSQTGTIPPFPGIPATSSPGLGGRHDPHHLLKGPAGLASIEALHRSGLFGAAYLERMREEHFKTKEEDLRRRDHSPRESLPKDRSESPVLNLSKVNDFRLAGMDFGRTDRHLTDRDNPVALRGRDQEHSDRRYHQDDDDILSDDDNDVEEKSTIGTGNGASSDNDRSNNNNKKSLIDNHDDRHSDAVDDVDDDVDEDDQDGAALGPLAGFQNLLAAAAAGGNNGTAAGEGEQQSNPDHQSNTQLGSVYGLIGNIQALLKMAVENAKKEERQLFTQKGDSKTDLDSNALHKEVEELKKNTALYFKRFKKEKRVRRKLQEQLELETRRRQQMEEALRATSADTLKRITESIAQEAAEFKMRSKRPLEEDVDEFVDIKRKQNRQQVDTDQRTTSPSEDGAISPTHSVSSSPQHFNAKIKTNKEMTERGSSPSDAPTIGFAKNLFPFNGSSLFGSAN